MSNKVWLSNFLQNLNVSCHRILERSFSLLILFTVLIFLKSCQSPSLPLEITHFTQNVMTIDYHISVGDKINREKRDQIQIVIDKTFQEINEIYNKWNPFSELSQVNNLPAVTPFKLSPKLELFFQKIDLLVHLSKGLFDPTIEPIQYLWKKNLEQGKSPSHKEIEEIRPFIGWHNLHISNGIIYKDYGETKLDLGGVAKGYCVDLLIERLHAIGLNHLFVEWGGEIRTLGFHPSQRPWRIFISRLGNPEPSQAIAYVELNDRAIATSGDYFQLWKVNNELGEKVYSHIINPITLFPVEVKQGSVASASLLALDCMTADALAKVLMLFDSPEEAKKWVKKLQKDYPDLACWVAVRDEKS